MIDLGLRVEKEIKKKVNHKETVYAARERMHRYPFNNFFIISTHTLKLYGSEIKCFHSKTALNFLFASQR